jgi:hypothetical protein
LVRYVTRYVMFGGYTAQIHDSLVTTRNASTLPLVGVKD